MAKTPEQHLKDFDKQVVAQLKELTLVEGSFFLRKIAMQMLTGVVMKTPVETGRLRGNWQLTLNAPAGGVVDVKDKSGGSTIAKGLKALDTMQLMVLASNGKFPSVFLTNNLPYIEVVDQGKFPDPPFEHGLNDSGETKTVHGFSRQAPNGMVGLTLQEVRTQFA